jgi:NDP-sugar pyrophosphorylase family protein
MNVLFLAAGTSGRILKISKGKPKPLIKVKGRSILSRNFNWFNKSKLISNYFINTFFKPKEIKNEIEKINTKYKISAKISYEKKLLGTAGAVKKLEKKLGDLFFVVYSDNLMNFDLNKMLVYHTKKKSDFTMALYSIKKNPYTGIASSSIKINKYNKIISFNEQRGSKGCSKYLVNTGVIILNNKIYKFIKKNKFTDFSNDVFPKVVESKKLKFYGYPIEKKNGYCLAIDTRDSYRNFIQIIKKIDLIN